MKQINYSILIIIFLLFAILPLPVAAEEAAEGSSDGRDIQIQCSFPGIVLEAGESTEFALALTNNGDALPKKLWVETFGESTDWEYQFLNGETEITRISIPKGSSQNIKFIVKTSSDTPVGEYYVKVHIGNGYCWLYIEISDTHAGERGILKLTTVNELGEAIKGATVTVKQGKDPEPVMIIKTSNDGKIRSELPHGEYILHIDKEGYHSALPVEVKVSSGLETDAGDIMLEKMNNAVEISYKTLSITTSIGKNPVFEMKLKNIGRADSTFTLHSTGLPENWYTRFKEAKDSAESLSEIFMYAGEEKTLYLEVIPSYGEETGDYHFTSVVTSPTGDDYDQELGVTLRGEYILKVYTDQYRYELGKGDKVSFDVRLKNTGSAGSLTNIRPEISAPEGWKATISPKTIASLEPGESNTISVTLIPPSNIAASEYKISLKVKSDQVETSDDFRMVVKESSVVTILGLLLLVGVAGGVWYAFRKHQRR
ncbi:NEW3 domain-containing protein [Methanogenium cariaci]